MQVFIISFVYYPQLAAANVTPGDKSHTGKKWVTLARSKGYSVTTL